MPKKKQGALSQTIMSLVFMSLGLFICIGSVLVGVDIACNIEIQRWIPIYPNAELIETQEGGVFRIRAAGITQQVYFTTDTIDEVRLWYTEYRRELFDRIENPRDVIPTLSGATERLVENPDGEGTFIYYYSECAI